MPNLLKNQPCISNPANISPWHFSDAQIRSFTEIEIAQADQNHLFEQWLERDTPDRILVDRQGKVVWCHIKKDHFGTKAHNILQLYAIEVGLVLPTELLLPILNAGNLAQAGQTRVALIERKFGCGCMMARVTSLGDEKLGPFGVTIASYRGLTDDVRADFKRIWDLSAGETRILAMTFQGLTVQDVAEASELSVETVRTHMRNIYIKVGVCSREALFATLGPAIG